jgi:hypothetical protein
VLPTEKVPPEGLTDKVAAWAEDTPAKIEKRNAKRAYFIFYLSISYFSLGVALFLPLLLRSLIAIMRVRRARMGTPKFKNA